MGKNECTQWKFYQGIRKYKKIQLEIKNSKAEINTHTHTHTLQGMNLQMILYIENAPPNNY